MSTIIPCSHCGRHLPEKIRFCPHCGTPKALPASCNQCGRRIPERLGIARFARISRKCRF
ncbi:MAG: zinc-ribbon domain-containing protein [Candidatus Thorarchaeota archaeon]